MRFLIRLEHNGINYVPLWKKTKKVGWKCDLVKGTNAICISCPPRKYKEGE